MKIKKILNNNAVLVGKREHDYIWIGSGLGFQKKPGQPADESKVEKIFILQQKKNSERMLSLLESIPIEYASLADDIIALAKDQLKVELSETILYFSDRPFV